MSRKFELNARFEKSNSFTVKNGQLVPLFNGEQCCQVVLWGFGCDPFMASIIIDGDVPPTPDELSAFCSDNDGFLDMVGEMDDDCFLIKGGSRYLQCAWQDGGDPFLISVDCLEDEESPV